MNDSIRTIATSSMIIGLLAATMAAGGLSLVQYATLGAVLGIALGAILDAVYREN